ncbi:MAG TPA: VOC family protein [Acidimicrobiales bacterium]|nr:VOC family protein [Acidimicrobiales bacterium]
MARQASGNQTSGNQEFQLRGINHLALVCSDMERTVDFYSNVLGMPLIKTIELPFGMGQHFFFDIGNGDALAFFWFPQAPPAAPGVASPRSLPAAGELTTAVASMNHVAFDVPADKIDEYLVKLRAKGIEAADIMNHDDSEMGVSRRPHEGTFVRSIYFFDPDGILLEFAAWTRALRADDVRHAPARASDTRIRAARAEAEPAR